MNRIHIATALLSLLALAAQGAVEEPPTLVDNLGHANGVTALAISRTQPLLATGGMDRTVRIWDLASARVVRLLPNFEMLVRDVAFTSDGGRLVAVDARNNLSVFDVRTGAALHRQTIGRGSVLTRDGLLIAPAPNGIALHDFTRAPAQRVLALPEPSRAYALSRDGTRLFGASASTLWMADAHGGRMMWTTPAPVAPLAGMAIDDDDTSLAMWTAEGAIAVADTKDGRVVLRSSCPGSPKSGSCAAGFLADGRQMFAMRASSIVVTDIASGRGEAPLTIPNVHLSLAIGARDGSVIAINDGALLQLDLKKSNSPVRRFASHRSMSHALQWSPDGEWLFHAGAENLAAWKWNRTTARFQALPAQTDGALAVAISPDVRWIASTGTDAIGDQAYPVTLQSLSSPAEPPFQASSAGLAGTLAFSGDGRYVATATTAGGSPSVIEVWNIAERRRHCRLAGSKGTVMGVAFHPREALLASASTVPLAPVGSFLIWDLDTCTPKFDLTFETAGGSAVAFDPEGRYVVFAGAHLVAWEIATQKPVLFDDLTVSVKSFAFVQKSQRLLAACADGMLRLWDVGRPPLRRVEHRAHSAAILGMSVNPENTLIATAGEDGVVAISKLEDAGAMAPVAHMLVSSADDWVTATPDGRFDVAVPEHIANFSWVFGDDPYRPWAPEIFLRDYWEPRLVARLLAGERFSRDRAIGRLNRVQPIVEIENVAWTDIASGRASVTVRVERGKDPRPVAGRPALSEMHDLRLFRDGQLVGWIPKPDAKDGNVARPVFPVRVPRRSDIDRVMWTAYAFNEDRVKSGTASRESRIPAGIVPRKGVAYVIAVGVNRTESSPAWDLEYAVNDATLFSREVTEGLRRARQFEKVVPITLASSDDAATADMPATTKSNLRAVLDRLAGRPVEASRLNKLGAGMMKRLAELPAALPEDLVFLAISSHGFTDDRGAFHFVLRDIGKGLPATVTDALLRRTLSSDELAVWLREIDAGELVLIVDACHSESTVKTESFKPGPMGSRGLGQLAYDKGMRVLAASRAEEAAIERGGEISQGLLTYALVREGLQARRADVNDDKVVDLTEWLGYAVNAVPLLFKEGDERGSVLRKGDPSGTRDAFHGRRRTRMKYQQPVLFDFARRRHGEAHLVPPPTP